MAVTEGDVRRIADLARLGLDEARVEPLVAELNAILDHMAVLQTVDTERAAAPHGGAAGSMPLRVDEGPQYPMTRSLDQLAPATREGFILVPRLTTHEHLEGTGEDTPASDRQS